MWDTGFYRYLDAVKERHNRQKITEVALVRSESAPELTSLRGYDGISSNLQEGLGTRQFVYLVWKTVKVVL